MCPGFIGHPNGPRVSCPCEHGGRLYFDKEVAISGTSMRCAIVDARKKGNVEQRVKQNNVVLHTTIIVSSAGVAGRT